MGKDILPHVVDLHAVLRSRPCPLMVVLITIVRSLSLLAPIYGNLYRHRSSLFSHFSGKIHLCAADAYHRKRSKDYPRPGRIPVSDDIYGLVHISDIVRLSFLPDSPSWYVVRLYFGIGITAFVVADRHEFAIVAPGHIHYRHGRRTAYAFCRCHDYRHGHPAGLGQGPGHPRNRPAPGFGHRTFFGRDPADLHSLADHHCHHCRGYDYGGFCFSPLLRLRGLSRSASRASGAENSAPPALLLDHGGSFFAVFWAEPSVYIQCFHST